MEGATMKNRTWLFLSVLTLCVVTLGGCARAARDTQGFAVTDTITVNASFDDAWQMAKAVLREKEYELYTRDKRGVFVAYTGKHHHFLGLRRSKFTVSLEAVSDSSTQITVEAIRQAYGSTLLTYPGWHDRKMKDHEESLAILKAIEAKAPGGSTATRSDDSNTATPAAKTS
jgi:hypothetical protein